MKWRFGVGSVALLLFVAHGSVRASVYDLYGFTPRTTAMGGAMTAAVTGYASTFYNPAALTVSKHGHVGIVGHLRAPSLFVERDPTLEDGTHPTVLPEFGGGTSVGWSYPLGGVFENRLAFGVSLHLPIARLVRVQGVDRLSPQFYMYQNLHDKMMLLVATAFEPWDWLSLGVGVQILSDLSGGATLDLDIVDGHFRTREFSVDIRPTASPNVGLHIRPMVGMAIGVTWRGMSAVKLSAPVQLSEGESLDMLLDVSQTVQFAPHRFTLGMSYLVSSANVTVTADAVLELWSAAPDPSPQLRLDIGGPLLTGIGLGEALDVSVDAVPMELGFSDTLTVRTGVEWSALTWLQLRAGYSFRPTPTPLQSGPTTYLDNDAHVVSFGAGFALFDPLDLHSHPLSLDVAVQSLVLVERVVSRTGLDDPLGSLVHGGQVWSVSLALSHAY
ncbi:MAG: OmpP1/FadL family transporter [Myxococcota bacterium]